MEQFSIAKDILQAHVDAEKEFRKAEELFLNKQFISYFKDLADKQAEEIEVLTAWLESNGEGYDNDISFGGLIQRILLDFSISTSINKQLSALKSCRKILISLLDKYKKALDLEDMDERFSNFLYHNEIEVEEQIADVELFIEQIENS